MRVWRCRGGKGVDSVDEVRCGWCRGGEDEVRVRRVR